MAEAKKEFDDAINLPELFSILKSKVKLILIYGVAVAILGLIVALISRNEFTSSIKVIPETKKGPTDLSNLGGIASIAGVDLGTADQGESLGPLVYPQIIRNPEFLYELSGYQINFNGGDSMTVRQYFMEDYTPPLPKRVVRGLIRAIKGKSKVQGIGSGEGVVYISSDDWEVIEEIDDRTNIFIDEVTGVVNIKCNMPDPVASATMTQNVYDMLYKYIAENKTRKARTKLEFVQERFTESKQRYDSLLERLAIYRDRNKNTLTEAARISLTRLEKEFNVATEVYSQLAGEYETAKIDLLDNTPLFTIIQSPLIPLQKSSPKRLLLLISSFVGGVFLGALVVIVKSL